MNSFEIFAKAPISEAILDIQAIPRHDVDVESLKAFESEISAVYTERKTIHFLQGEFKLPKDGVVPDPVQKSGKFGYRFQAPSENKVVQVKADGYTFNKLKPYTNWREFRSEAQRWWDKYAIIAKPEKISRISLRYINIINAPLPFSDFNEYLLTNPQIAPGLPQNVSNFFMRLELPDPNFESVAVITMTMKSPEPNNSLPLVLDIDVIKIHEYEIEKMDQVWVDFELLREFKNQIFFKTTTEKAKELFR